MMSVTFQAHTDFLNSLKQYRKQLNLDIESTVSKEFTDSLTTEINSNIKGLVNSTQQNLMSKALAFRQSVETDLQNLAQKALQNVELIDEKLETISATTFDIDYENITKEQRVIVDKQWKKLTNNYGASDTVRYQNGANYPLRPYLDGRAITTANDVYRATISMDSVALGITTGKISDHGQCCDSCKKWQNQIVFFTENGRQITGAKYSDALLIPTMAELESNSDHIFKFNCLHYVSPYPIEFFGEKETKNIIVNTEKLDVL